MNKNHYLQLVLHLDHKVVCASQRASRAIAAETGRLRRTANRASRHDWNWATELRQCLAKCAVSCDWILCESVLCCRSCCLFFSLSLPFFDVVFVVVIYLRLSAKPCSFCIRACFIRPFKAHARACTHTHTHVGRRRSITDLSAAGTGVYLTGRLDEWKADIRRDLTDIKTAE